MESETHVVGDSLSSLLVPESLVLLDDLLDSKMVPDSLEPEDDSLYEMVSDSMEPGRLLLSDGVRADGAHPRLERFASGCVCVS